jgi:ribonuclease HII
MVWVAGVDEAGRGPVLGPMVVCAFGVPNENESKLLDLGVKDSKMLSAKKREALVEPILLLGKAVIVSSSAIDLNIQMNRFSLNDIEAKIMACALTALEKIVDGNGFKLARGFDSVFIDTPDPVLSTYKTRLKRTYGGKSKLVCAHKADQLYPVVSAASILAKVSRDASIASIKKECGADFGSGYSHDKKTMSFLKNHWSDKTHPIHAHVRTHWATAKKLSITQFKLAGFI